MTEGFLNMNKMIQSLLEAFTSQVAKTLASNLNQNMPVSVPTTSHERENPIGSSRQTQVRYGKGPVLKTEQNL